MWSILLCVCVLAAVDGAPLPEALHYVGVGYNLVKGNPDGDFWSTSGDDPGLLSTRKVLKLAGAADTVPAELVYEHHDHCQHSNEVAFFHDTHSYQGKLLERIHTSGTNNAALLAVAFTGSAGYRAIEQQTRRDFYFFQDAQTTCILGQARYKLALSHENHYSLTDEFAAAACALPHTYDEAVYRTFIDTWGTHVTSGVEIGSKIITRHVAPIKDFVHFVLTNSSHDVSLGGPFMNHASSLVVDMSSYKYRTLYRHIVGNLIETLTVGSDAIPEPIGMTMIVISDMFDAATYWQNLDHYVKEGHCPSSAAAHITMVQPNVERALREYANVTAPVSTPVAIPVTWPEGTYTLPRPKSGCPTGDFTWFDGKRVQDTESNAGNNDWSVGNHFDADLKTDEFTLKYCTKTEAQPTEFDMKWPKGDYCIFKHGACPADFEEGYVKWDDEDDTNNNDWDGVLPDGVYDEDTLQRYCCRSDALPMVPIILPTDKPFYLFQYKREICQQVVNMSFKEEYLRWDNEDFVQPSRSGIGAVHPGMKYWNGASGPTGSEIYYCYYSPQTKLT